MFYIVHHSDACNEISHCPAPSCWGCESFPVLAPNLSHSVVTQVIQSSVMGHSACVQGTLILLNNAIKAPK